MDMLSQTSLPSSQATQPPPRSLLGASVVETWAGLTPALTPVPLTLRVSVEVGGREQAWAVTPLTSPLRPTVCLYGVPGDGLHGNVPQAAPEERAAGASDPRHLSHVLPDRALPGH